MNLDTLAVSFVPHCCTKTKLPCEEQLFLFFSCGLINVSSLKYSCCDTNTSLEATADLGCELLCHMFWLTDSVWVRSSGSPCLWRRKNTIQPAQTMTGEFRQRWRAIRQLKEGEVYSKGVVTVTSRKSSKWIGRWMRKCRYSLVCGQN